MVSSNSSFIHQNIKGALQALLILLFFSISSYSFVANAVGSEGAWEVVPGATVVQGKVYRIRRVGFYTRNTITISGNPTLSDQLRLVVTATSHEVTNADGTDSVNNPYFELASVSESTRIDFNKKRGRVNYTAELQQFIPIIDTDGDGIADDIDSCPLDIDNDADGDGVCGDVDNCPVNANSDQADFDQDSTGDACDTDNDNDLVDNNVDNCPMTSNTGQENFDQDAQGDACDNDDDNDGVNDIDDLCPMEAGANADGCNAILLCPIGDPNCITITGLIFGNGASLNNAAVKVGTNSVNTSSDLAGEFTAAVGAAELANDGIDDFFPVQVVADGFASGYAKVVLLTGTSTYEVSLNLQQVSDTITEDDDITAGVELIKNGSPVGKLTIPQGALPAGVTGITGAITYLDPETDDILSMPGGDLLALPEGANPNLDSPVQLETFGMMEFDLVDQNGNPITELGGDAEVCMKAPTGLVLNDIIPLWYYDEDDGLWKGEGQGTVVDRNGQLMICGEVSHFSWWNYDQPIATHSCMRFEILPEGVTGDLSDLTWYSEGITYNGASPRRVCSDDGGASNFESFTVKVSTVSKTEKIRVYTNIGGSKFYLLDDLDDTYSLTQSSTLAAVFNTPIVQGSCLSNTLSGTCINLDHDGDNNGVIPLSADINFPPVITEFTVADQALLAGESMIVGATVTDPEGFNVDLNWSVNCGYYGSGNGSESMTPSTQTGGSSGGVFTSTMTAPTSLNYFVEYCQVSLTATDSAGLTTTADRWVTVAASFDYQVQGVVYGIDGLPLPFASVTYYNYDCDNQSQLTTTDVNGIYTLDIDISQCSENNQYFYFYNLGYIDIEYTVDGLIWTSEFYISNGFNGEGGGPSAECSVLTGGETLCQFDINLPTLWGPLSGKVHQPVGSSNGGLSINPYGNGNAYMYLQTPVLIDEDINGNQTYGPILVPIGEGNINYFYTLDAGTIDEQTRNFYPYYTMNSLDGTARDLVGEGLDIVAPVTVTVFDGTGNGLEPFDNDGPVIGADVNISGYPDNNSGSVQIADVTDINGLIPSLLLPIGSVNLNAQAGTYFFNTQVAVEGQPLIIDLGSSELCEVRGTVFDEFGVGKPSAIYNWYSYQGNNNSFDSFTTDVNGEFSLLVTPGQMDIYSNEVFNYRNINIDNCRQVNGLPRVIRVDISHSENFFGGENF